MPQERRAGFADFAQPEPVARPTAHQRGRVDVQSLDVHSVLVGRVSKKILFYCIRRSAGGDRYLSRGAGKENAISVYEALLRTTAKQMACAAYVRLTRTLSLPRSVVAC